METYSRTMANEFMGQHEKDRRRESFDYGGNITLPNHRFHFLFLYLTGPIVSSWYMNKQFQTCSIFHE
ncbi:hypothetical protein WN55_10599 [Dufourea novaeangliae]|uniref:Uncharacterized protein n=1 Tax=Dufourea novaeangliae TaxID=178035 RepID=A0A154P4A7_DUFNO|nr:hypothetical protein WN55_10599 [Dufourea novaeangliae]